MEKLLQPLIISILLFCFKPSFAQVYVVFDKTGYITQKFEEFEMPINKGNVVNKGKLILKDKNTQIKLIDQDGTIYKIDKPGIYDIKEIIQFKIIQENTNFTKQYLSYIWDEISGKTENYTHTANVYRSTYPDFLELPKDSATIYGNAISFKWQHPKSENGIYLFLLNQTKGNLTKFFLKGTEFAIYKDSNLLIADHQYKWFVNENKFPDFNALVGGNFFYKNEQDYYIKKNNLLKTDPYLSKNKLSNFEIDDFICRFYYHCLTN